MDIEKAVESLRNGGVILHPTDTCYGYACDYFSEEARVRLCELKKMSPDKPLTMMLASVDEIPKYAEISEKAQELIDKYLPGRLTLVLLMKEGEGTVGIRVPDYPLCHKLCEAFGGPLVTTSANISGEPSVYLAEGIEADYAIDRGQLPENKPSTVVKVVDGSLEILRHGDLNLEG